ncbi:putative sugar nucleotidyl transferase [Chitinophaga filiformis]|uniref:UDP-N-acetylglucosamine diphosphorylase/glucosamine-1-phosphate N-acetyltransferase n=1 Tax=Chitinophaga filiformis TaxID=104663 RepID=A0A1G8A208_CHIFI|nr:putative sugar nucleotidyl transferase [Chitinophaga filiformis]SDH14926.1 UDP-N-acetylglucosamine diphosphorylase/glucosamine-1-phosphate N-acetyltransferase [Chitinophaga filiformis]
MERNYILFDTPARELLYPFTHTRPVAACRIGILTIREKWEYWLNAGISYLTVPHLQKKYPLKKDEAVYAVLIHGHVLPDETLVQAIQELQPGQELYKGDEPIAKVVAGNNLDAEAVERKEYLGAVSRIRMPWDFFLLNDQAIRSDFELLTKERVSAPISDTNKVTAPERIFLEEGAVVEHSILNASTGPIYVGRNAEIMEGCLIRGALALGEKAVLKMGSKVYGATTLGPGSVGGGEIKNVVMFGHSNKGHDGYLGDAVIGEWCNLGANATASNLKNNASTVKVWMEAYNRTESAGLKCGLLMGDYSRCGIGSMLNTGTVIGVSCNIFGGSLPPKFIPSFSWGGADGLEPYRLEQAVRDAGMWMQFKGRQMEAADRQVLEALFTILRD